MAFADMFKVNKAPPMQQGTQQVQQSTQQGNNQQRQTMNGDQTNNQNANPPGDGNNGNSGNATPPDPLSPFAKMWDTPGEGDKAPSFTLDPKTLDSVSGSQDFMKGIDPALMQKLQSGDMTVLPDIIQASTRNAYRSALEHGSMLTDKFVGARETHNEKSFANRVKGELTQVALSDTRNYAHPVVRTQLTEIAKKLQAQHPDSSPQEIAKMSKDYLNELVTAINPEKAPDKPAPGTVGSTNWDKYFDEENQESFN